MKMNGVKKLIDQALEIKIGSGIAVAWGDLSKREHHSYCAGRESHRSDSGAITPNTVFDLASLTKIVATTSLYMKWVDEGKLLLEDAFPGHHHEFTFEQLLRHSSGLPAWKPFYESMIKHFGDADALMVTSIEERRRYFYEQVFQTASAPLAYAPGEKIVYSDVGFLLLSHFAEVIGKKSFDQVVQSSVWDRIFPKGEGLSFHPLKQRSIQSGVAATEVCPWRGWLQGEVHDDNCWTMGGVAGHAGAFGSLNDVLKWMHALVEGRIASFKTLKLFSQGFVDRYSQRRAVGFDVPSLDGSGSTASAFSMNSIGHLGFTGTSFWLDLETGKYAILLTNRVHPSREDNRIRDLRRAFHQAIAN